MTTSTSGAAAPGTATPSAPRSGALLGTQLLFNVGFFAVVPFLAGILREDFALAGASVGLVLGLRTAAQQGLFLFGGALADRFGARFLILLGCAVRVAGFSLLAWSTADVLALTREPRLALFIAGTVLTGMGGALFSPALEALVARADARRQGSGRKTTLFALLAVFGETGAAIGPVVGAALLGWGFAAVAGGGAVLFVLIALVLCGILPREERTGRARRASSSFATVLRDRRYVALALLASVNLLAYNQLYLGYPVELTRVGAGDGTLALIFATVSILTITLQLPVARLSRRWGEARALRLGYLLLTTAFVVLAVTAPRVPADDAGALVPVFVSTVLLTLGHLILTPLVLSLVPRFGSEQCWGAYYGLLATCGGVVVLVGNIVLGSLYSLADRPALEAAWVWIVLAVLPLLSGWLVPRLVPTAAPVQTPHFSR